MTEPMDLLNRATDIAPIPDGPDAKKGEWVRYYAAEAMAAFAAFRLASRTAPGPDLGYLAALGTAAAAAVIALQCPPETATRMLWELNPEGGDLNGDVVDQLADVLVLHGINPADLYPWYEAADFTAPLQLPPVEVAR